MLLYFTFSIIATMKNCQLATAKSALAGKPVLTSSSKHGGIRMPKHSGVVKAIAEPSTSLPFYSDSDHLKKWSHDSWKNYPALQQPNYPDKVLPPLLLASSHYRNVDLHYYALIQVLHGLDGPQFISDLHFSLGI